MSAFVSRILLLVAGLVFALGATELTLRLVGWGEYDVGDMEPGLLEYDRTLGWKLVPGAEISHRHQDFDVTYRADNWGLRNDDQVESPRQADEWVLGDSFTFGIGVEDDETFVARLNQQASGNEPKRVNLGQIGYATDQEALWLEKLLEWHGKPERVTLVVYVGNDLVDNLHPVPTQAPRPKPMFEMRDGALQLSNVPVPRTPQSSPSFAREVLGRLYAPGRLERFLESTKTGSLIWSVRNRTLGHPQLDWEDHFDDQLELFEAIILRMAEQVPRLELVLLGGKASVEDPGSFGGQYQHYLRDEIMDLDFPDHVGTHDLISHLRASHQQAGQLLFHPREGHLTSAGHQAVADAWPRN